MENIVEKFGPHAKRDLLPGIAPFVVGAFMYATALIPVVPEKHRVTFLVTACLVCLVATALTIYSSTAKTKGKIASWRILLASEVFVLGAFLLHLLVGTPTARFVTVTAVMLILLWFVMRVDSAGMGTISHAALVSAARQLDWLGMFLLSVFAFGLLRYTGVAPAVVAAALGLLQAIVTYESALDADVSSGVRKKIAFAVGLLGAELFIGLSFLPTPFTANAAAAVLAHFALTRSLVRVFGAEPNWRGIGLGLVGAMFFFALVLGTARWI